MFEATMELNGWTYEFRMPFSACNVFLDSGSHFCGTRLGQRKENRVAGPKKVLGSEKTFGALKRLVVKLKKFLYIEGFRVELIEIVHRALHIASTCPTVQLTTASNFYVY